MTKDEVLSKIRKLFELSNSPNENEAALAAAKARALLSRYNLSMADLPTDNMKNALAATERCLEVGKVLRNWVKGLLISIAMGFECEHVIRRRYGAAPLLTFIGTPADAEVALYTFEFLYRELNGLADKALPALKRDYFYWSASSLRYAYLDGAVKRIGERFLEQTKSVRQAEQNGCQALMVVKERAIRDYMASAFPHLRKEYAKTRAVSANAFMKGYSDAGDISLRQSITDF